MHSPPCDTCVTLGPLRVTLASPSGLFLWPQAGMIEEMMSDSIDSALDEDGVEEETEAEVDKVLAEIAGEYVAALPGTQAAKQVGTPSRPLQI
eukprot:3950757-Pyramimonas_sp.AAC.1